MSFGCACSVGPSKCDQQSWLPHGVACNVAALLRNLLELVYPLMQVIMASDFAIAQFWFLESSVLVHELWRHMPLSLLKLLTMIGRCVVVCSDAGSKCSRFGHHFVITIVGYAVLVLNRCNGKGGGCIHLALSLIFFQQLPCHQVYVFAGFMQNQFLGLGIFN